MKTVVIGECRPESTFVEEDWTVFSETEFEYICINALACVLPKYLALRFESAFCYDGTVHKPDLALIAKDFSHWFVVEVELISHSFRFHVLPQVKAFRYGDVDVDHAARTFAKSLKLDDRQSMTLAAHVPRSVVVVANRFDPQWEHDLAGHDVQLLSVSKYRSNAGEVGHEVMGTLTAAREVVAWATYSVTDRSLRTSPSARLPAVDEVQLVDAAGFVSSWDIRRDPNSTWLTKQSGVPELLHGQVVQIVRNFDGRLSLRIPR